MIRKPILLFISIALVSVFIVLNHRTPWVIADEIMYARGAWNIMYEGFTMPEVHGVMNYPPLYSLLLSPASLMGDIRFVYLGYQIINIMMLLVGMWLIFDAGRIIRSGPLPLLAALIYAVTPSSLVYVPLIMSENLMLLLSTVAGYAVFRWTRDTRSSWLILGWIAALSAPFCRGTGIIVPIAFGAAVFRGSTLEKYSERWIKWVLAVCTGAALVLLIILPTSIFKVYHPITTVSTVIRSMGSLQGWRTLGMNSLTELALLITATAGLITYLAARGPEQQQPIRRYLRVLIIGLFFITIGYMQYGSQGPNADSYRAIQRYLDSGIATIIPWIFLLSHEFRQRTFAIIMCSLIAICLLVWPEAGFKPGQTLALSGFGLSTIEYPGILGRIPTRILLGIFLGAVGLVSVFMIRKRPVISALFFLILILPVTIDAVLHEVWMSRARERAEPELWRLQFNVPDNAEIIIDQNELNDESLAALYSGIFWLPGHRVQIVNTSSFQPTQGNTSIQVSRSWLPDRLLHAGSHKWYDRGRSKVPITHPRLFYDFGTNDNNILFNAPPADMGNARWTGEAPVIELHLDPADYILYFGHTRMPAYGDCSARLSLNGSTIGIFSSIDSLPAFRLPKEAMRSDGRQRLSLRVSPMHMNRPDGLWLHGLRLDWIYCVPAEFQ